MKIITKDSKPGPGVSKDAPEKRRFFLFFELYFSKIGKLISLNFIYLLFLIPLMLGLYFSITLNPDIKQLSDLGRMQLFTIAPDYISLIILLVSVFLTGPATAGFVYVLRNLQRREHAWVFSDFWEQFKKNYLQGLAMSVIDLIAYTFLYIAFGFYMFVMPTDMPDAGNLIPNIAAGIVVAITLVFTWAHYYIYTMMVTFEMKLFPIFKNSIIFAVAKLPLNIFITLIIAAVTIGCLYLFVLSPTALAILVGLALVSTVGFIIVFSTYPTIDANMIQKVKTEKRVLNTRG